MGDPSKPLNAKYQLQNRYSNFGPALLSIAISGFRGIGTLKVDFNHPITAISGLNGAGKSTVAQLCLAAYRKPSTVQDKKRFYVRDFFPMSPADPAPFSPTSSVLYQYNTSIAASPQTLKVSRAKKEWSGYSRQPERSCYYLGFTIYIPKVEQRDLSVYSGAHLALGALRPIPDEVRERVSRVLGSIYDGMHFQEIAHGKRNGSLGIAERLGAKYSENNMGFGEGRTFYLMQLLENSPTQSLFVIEEPETALHEAAQYELGRYLLDVCNRRHHQLILTTHSSALLESLPADSRVLLARTSAGVEAFPQMSSAQVRSILSAGHHKALEVLVEDEFAVLMLREMIRRVDSSLLDCIKIHPVGTAVDVRNAAKFMSQMGRAHAAVRDADVGPDEPNSIFSFPGSAAPEREVFLNTSVQSMIQSKFKVSVSTVITQRGVKDHHQFAKVIAEAAHTSAEHLSSLAVEAYLAAIGDAGFHGLVGQLKGRIPA